MALANWMFGSIRINKKNFKVLVIDKNENLSSDNRTLAVNANSTDFLKGLGLWKICNHNLSQ